VSKTVPKFLKFGVEVAYHELVTHAKIQFNPPMRFHLKAKTILV